MKKMVKSLLLGSAAGLVAIAGAQAADLPVKAKPVDYVRICSAYGAGFYYIPGTDICLRVGGYMYIEAGWNARNAVPHIYSGNIGAPLIYDRDDNASAYRVSAVMIMDARAQTAIGVVRTYLALGVQAATNALTAGSPIAYTPYMERAFIQFAGFTAGYAATFFDFGAFYSIYGLSSIAWHWTPLFAYTAQFGNGLSATISFEEGTGIRGKLTTGTYTGTSTAASAYGGHEIPDIVGNIRVDQVWGSAQIMGALHQLRVNQLLATAGTGDAWGWAIGGGIEVKTPMIAPGDSIILQGVWSQGAVEYTGLSAGPVAGLGGIGLRNTALVGPALDVFDAYYNAPGAALQLTEAWSWNLMFRHFWQPNLRSAFWVGYNFVAPGGNSATALGADPNFAMWQAGANVIWSPAPTLDLSLDVLYSNLSTASCTGAAALTQLRNCDVTADIWSIWTRWRRNF